MFVALPTRTRPSLRWATPLLFAVLWLAYLWASTRPESARRLWLLDWGALTGGAAIALDAQKPRYAKRTRGEGDKRRKD